MTGAFVRIKRDGKWINAEIDQLTDAELVEFFAACPEKGPHWAFTLASWIRDNVKSEPKGSA